MKLLFSLLFLSLFGKDLSLTRKIAVPAILSDTFPYRAYQVNSGTERVIVIRRQGSLKLLPAPIMVTNGGMFDPDYAAHGLLVCDHNAYKPLDRRTAKGANFYMQPNGVFYVDKGKYFIVPTKIYAGLYVDDTPEFATQSGPMLVAGDSINKTFDQHSQYLNTRSGVGILPNGNPIFIIAEGISFYDFAAIFKDRFHCRNALFLDGGVSEMFVGEKEQERLSEYHFGPIIAVFKK